MGWTNYRSKMIRLSCADTTLAFCVSSSSRANQDFATSKEDCSMSSHDGTFPSVDRVAVDLDAIQSFTREEEFTALAFDLLREVTSYVTIAACVMGPEPQWNRDQAAIGGNMVRLWKILNAFLDQKMQRRYETTTIFARLAFETIVSVRYLAENFDPDLVDNFVRFSFRHERRLADKINRSISERAVRSSILSSGCSTP
jgi:hypothetical protein